jgi:hypothetical protein
MLNIVEEALDPKLKDQLSSDGKQVERVNDPSAAGVLTCLRLIARF